MKIAVIGTGSVGGTLGRAWAAKGHDVCFGVKRVADPKLQTVLEDAPGVRAIEIPGALVAGEVIVLAVPFPAATAVLQSASDLSGKIVIDCTNPLTPDFSDLSLGFSTSAAETIAASAKGASVFKTLNHTGYNVMAQPAFGEQKAVMFVAGDDAARKPAVLSLVADLGFEAIDTGPLRIARLLEPLAMLWIHLALVEGQGRDFAFGLLRR